MTDDTKPKMIQVRDETGKYIEVEQDKFYHEEADAAKQQQIINQEKDKAKWDRIAAACDRFDTLQKATGTEMALSEEEMVAAMYLSLLNWQHFYPAELGGKARFAAICQEVQAWFLANKDK